MEPRIDEAIYTPEQKEAIENKHIACFELIGTTLLVYISVCSQGNDYYVALGYFGCLLLFARLSGGHFNPAVSLAMLLSGGITGKTFFIYFVPQMIGAFLGGLLAFCLLDMNDAPYYESAPLSQLAASLFGELLGCTIFYIFILVQFVKETKLTENKILGLVFISVIYYACREYTITSSSSLLNPAAALSLTIFNCLSKGWNQLINLWIFVAGPIVASFLATMFYSTLYQSMSKRR